ncbi:cyclin-dependent kinase B2-1 [Lolium perenne]|uniref:cyclin-dependent kinase B2-1 n=1 Tax=Lolium perenne TaxID=4522 RepID=UPI0021F5CE47|nr:cyclin-dependent kinase B2-1-like [Lolium perenne]
MSDPMEIEIEGNPMGNNSQYKMIEVLGRGSFGRVYKMMHIATNKIVAVKHLFYPGDQDGLNPHFIREVANLKKLSACPQVVTLLDDFTLDGQTGRSQAAFLVLEFMESDLERFIQRYDPMNPTPASTVKILMYQICKGVHACHKESLLHRDLKPNNLLVNSSTLELKLGDLGLSRDYCDHVVREHTAGWVFVNYKCPELYLGERNYSRATDMWSVGCIFAELVTTKQLFPGPEADVMPQIFRLFGTPNEAIWPGVTSLPKWSQYAHLQNYPTGDLTQEVHRLDPVGVDLLKGMLQYDPKKRISAKSALEHPYFNDVDKRRY